VRRHAKEMQMSENDTATIIGRSPRLHTLVLPVSGRQLTLRRGDMLEIQMRQIVGSGSAWTVASTPESVSFELDDHYEGQRGSFSTRLFRFRAIESGAGLLRLAIARPDMPEPLGLVDLHLTVTA
jgi:hypothetical protein